MSDMLDMEMHRFSCQLHEGVQYTFLKSIALRLYQEKHTGKDFYFAQFGIKYIMIDTDIREWTHYLSDKTKVDVSSKGASSSWN